MSIGQRIISGSIANSAGIGMNAFLQIVSVPILASTWGVEKYGLWVMLTTVPTYFALTDLGFLQAATSDMTMQMAENKKENVLASFQSTSLLIVFICLIFLIVISLIVTATYALGILAETISIPILFYLSIFSALSLFSRISVSALRATGNYAIGSITFDLMTTLEGLAGLITAYLGGDFLGVVICLVLLRLANIYLLNKVLRRRVPWLNFGIKYASRSEISRLLKPALAAMAIPIALAINLQGVVLIVGSVISPAAAATYTPVRTCSRLLIQIVGVINRATMPEMAAAYARADREKLSSILLVNGIVIAAVLIPGCLVFAIFGKEIVQVWSAGTISASGIFIGLVAASTIIHGLWYFASNVLLATNTHVAFAKYSLGTSVVTLLMVLIFSRFMGLNGTGIALLMGELLSFLAMVRVVILSHRKLLGWI